MYYLLLRNDYKSNFVNLKKCYVEGCGYALILMWWSVDRVYGTVLSVFYIIGALLGCVEGFGRRVCLLVCGSEKYFEKCWQSELCPVADVDGWAGEM